MNAKRTANKRVAIPIKWVFLAITSLLLVSSTRLAPAPDYLAINYETKECGRYWGGDEYTSYDLPSGWVKFDYRHSNGYWLIETRDGTCKIPKKERENLFKDCCLQLGYPYVSGNVGVYDPFPQVKQLDTETIVLYGIVSFYMIVLITAGGIWLYRRRRS